MKLPAVTAIWAAGEQRTISWETHGTGMGIFGSSKAPPACRRMAQNRRYFAGGLPTVIMTTIPLMEPGGGIDCTDPDAGCPNVRLRVIDVNTQTIFDQPGNPGSEFDIQILPILKTLLPTSTALQIGSTTTAVTWDIEGSLGSTVDVFYSTNDDFVSHVIRTTGTASARSVRMPMPRPKPVPQTGPYRTSSIQ